MVSWQDMKHAGEPARRCVELPQNGMYTMLQKNGRCYVEHVVSGEVGEPPPGRWCLRSKGDRLFAVSDAIPPESIWMSNFLRTAMWTVDGRPLVTFQEREGMAASNMWLDEISRRFTVDSLKLTIAAVGKIPLSSFSVKVYIFSLPRAGATIFWELDAFKHLIAVDCKGGVDKYFRNGVRQGWWPWLRSHAGVPGEHFLPGSHGIRGATQVKEFIVHKNSMATAALLKLCYRWSVSCGSASARMAARLLLKTLLQLMPENITFATREPNRVDGLETYTDVNVRDGMLLPCAALQGAWFVHTRHQVGWPHVAVNIEELHAVIVAVGGAKIALDVLDGVGRLIEVEIRRRQTSSAELMRNLASTSRFYIDPQLKTMVAYSLSRLRFL